MINQRNAEGAEGRTPLLVSTSLSGALAGDSENVKESRKRFNGRAFLGLVDAATA